MHHCAYEHKLTVVQLQLHNVLLRFLPTAHRCITGDCPVLKMHLVIPNVIVCVTKGGNLVKQPTAHAAQNGSGNAWQKRAAKQHACTCLQIHGILNVNDVLTREGLVCQQIFHELGLDIQLLNGLICIHIA